MKKFFFRRVRKFIFCMTVPMCIIFLMSLYNIVQTTNQEIIQQGQQTVDAVQTNFEIVISNVLYQNALLSNSTKMSIALRKILSESTISYSDSIYISSLRSILSSISSSHDYIDSIYLYLDAYDNYFSSVSGVKNIIHSTDISWLDCYRDMAPEVKNNIVVRKQNTMLDNIRTLSIFQRLLLQKGCIVVNINIQNFKEMLKNMSADKYETIFLLNEDGQILLNENCNNNALEIEQEYFTRLFESTNKNYEELHAKLNGKWKTYQGKRYLFSITKYEAQNVYIVSSISMTSMKNLILSMVSVYVLIFICNCIIIVLISYTITKRSFQQIQYMIDLFDNAEKGIYTENEVSVIKDEFSVIMNNVIHLFINTSYLNMQLKDKQYRQELLEQKALQLQINPHFLYNTLQTLDMEIRKIQGISGDASKMIHCVSDILKYSLSNSHESVTVETEILFLKKYMEIQKIRFGNKVIIYYEIDNEVMQDTVFKLMLQPIVENSILHGIRGIHRQGYIKVKMFRREGDLYCYVIDNGVGMRKDEIDRVYSSIKNDSSKSIGLANVNRRLVLKYGDQSALKIHSKYGMGTSIFFKIPI